MNLEGNVDESLAAILARYLLEMPILVPQQIFIEHGSPADVALNEARPLISKTKLIAIVVCVFWLFDLDFLYCCKVGLLLE